MGSHCLGRSLSVSKMIAKVVLTTVALSSFAQAQLFGTDNNSFNRISQPVNRFSQPVNNNNQIVNQVIDQLSPAITQAVTNALRGLNSNRPSSGGSRPADVSSATPAQYDFEYKVANDGTQTYIAQQESRDGLEVRGMYKYVDPTGAIVTVTYTAGVDGYQETRERQERAVRIAPATSQGTGVAHGARNQGLNVDQIIQQVLRALQPAITQSVNNVVNRRG